MNTTHASTASTETAPPASYSEQAAAWLGSLQYEDLPKDVLENTKLRILDIVGLTLAGSKLRFSSAWRARIG